jgi:hypothetical protein
MSGQIPLSLDYEVSWRPDNFSVTKSNSEAFAKAMGDWSSSRFMLNADIACGKTHLLNVWLQKQREAGNKTLLLSGLELMARAVSEIISETNFIGFDDLDLFFTELEPTDAKHGEDKIFHLIEAVDRSHGKMLFTSRLYAVNFPSTLHERVLSRLRSADTGFIKIRDDEELLQAMLLKQFGDRGIDLSPTLVAGILSQVQRSPEAIRKFVESADIASLAENGGKLTRPTIHAIIRSLDGKPNK